MRAALFIFFSGGLIMTMLGMYRRSAWLACMGFAANLTVYIWSVVVMMGIVFNPTSIVPLFVNVLISLVGIVIIWVGNMMRKKAA